MKNCQLKAVTINTTLQITQTQQTVYLTENWEIVENDNELYLTSIFLLLPQ